MRIHRFFVDSNLSLDEEFVLPKQAAHHCVQVLRYSLGAHLHLFNGDGYDYLCEITSLQGKNATVKVLRKIELENESPLQIHLYQCVAKGDKMDLVIQKAVELGVSEITPVFSERSNVKLDLKRLAKKQEHWQNIAISAMEQSGRALKVEINTAVKLNSIVLPSSSTLFYLEPRAIQSFSNVSLKSNQVALIIGPEGGFSDNDLSYLANIEAKGVKLGPRILRTETAGLTCIAIIQSRFGDI
ncbi:MAG: 16S rRNA (uracil(1498)-N(3))-methyltransferase [Kangiellaceae bacterium]|nr:16S rRNA (uracil(1498)-N(3))-methyltransferase [Kangiellaceae bacterium]MCW9000966.1 16S rRNA (uracil(1498)-N(3))-methyltransferase [Kangiellaceae bacterium]MCW9015529.1 16S rRNA (uracil(1498)-N(3))-methyltransferase [Kangiellaceae bacterium]